MTASSRAGALNFLIGWYALSNTQHHAPKDLAELIGQAQQIESFLGQDYEGTDSAVLAEIRSSLEGLTAKMTELTQAFADLNAAIDADASDKDALKATIVTLNQTIADLQGVNATDEAAVTAANQAVADAAGQVEAAAQRLQPLPVPPPVPTPDPTPTPTPDPTPAPVDPTPAPVDPANP